jgi:hypothetical protein
MLTERPRPKGGQPKAAKAPGPGSTGGRRARAAIALLGISATVGALVAVGTAFAIYLLVLAIQSALG